ncbi:unnamed protein product [Thelazia callipaeda]|uniref:HMG box domain-containing protein n=1 Tax=Thelazia callipaeda TaxID=103827 RepID=A0A0N5CKY7_THECL|nr:unnamed protein product [Thelazia callipaeda]
MLLLRNNLCRASLVGRVSTTRSYVSMNANGSSVKFERLPPGFGRTTPFNLFVKENFALGKNEVPTQIFVNLTKQWRNLGDDEKKKYVDKAVQLNEEKKLEFESLSDGEKEELFKRAQASKEARLKRKIRLERRKACFFMYEERECDSQRTISGWMLFVKEKAIKGIADPSKKQQDIIKELAIVWKSLPESERLAYNERAKNLKSH